jgi:hypothetical protein
MLAYTRVTMLTVKYDSQAGGPVKTHAKLINVGVVADPGEVLPNALAQRHFLDVRVLVAEVVRAADVEAGQGGETTQHSQAGGRLVRHALAVDLSPQK